MKKELENGKLCARGTVLFSGHSLCSVTEVADTSNGSNNEHALTCVEISEQVGGDSETCSNYPIISSHLSACTAPSKVLGNDSQWPSMPCVERKFK